MIGVVEIVEKPAEFDDLPPKKRLSFGKASAQALLKSQLPKLA